MSELFPGGDLLRSLPPIRRARLWRLYGENGRRYLDLYQDGGRSILGARSRGFGTAVKAALDMGLDRPLPSVWTRRLETLVIRRWPGYAALRLFPNEACALAAIARAGGRSLDEAGQEYEASALVDDPAREKAAGAATAPLASLLRPFHRFLRPVSELPLGLPLLPCPRALAPAIVLFRDAELAQRTGPSALLPPLLLRAACQGIQALERYEAEIGEEHWKRSDRHLLGLFERRGPYLYPRSSTPGSWPRFFGEALEKGLLLSPDPELPSLLPGDFDEGELAPLAGC